MQQSPLTQPRITENEVKLLKSLFEREELYLLVRNLFFGFELTEEEQQVIAQAFKTPETRVLMRKIFKPELQKDIPIGQNFDLWQTQDVKAATKDNFEDVVDAKFDLLTMIETALKRLDNPAEEGVDLSVHPELPLLIARNSFINYIDAQLQIIWTLVNKEDESAEEALMKLKKNSSK